MVMYDNNGNKAKDPTGIDLAQGKKQIILVTHDESTFYDHNHWETFWQYPDSVKPVPKGDGQSLIVSDFLTFEWGRLTYRDMYVLIYSNAYMLNFSILGRPGNFSGQEKIGRDSLEMTTCANKWTGPSTFLK